MKFSIGDHVEMTSSAIDTGLDGRLKRRTGVVTGVHVLGDYIGVRRDGEKKSHMWASVFWKRRG